MKRIYTKTFLLLLMLVNLCALTVAQEKKIIYVYDEYDEIDKYLWSPELWMPDGEGISFQSNCKEDYHVGKSCIKIGFNFSKNSWVGIYWLTHEFLQRQGINLYDELKIDKKSSIVLTFWARGEFGGEKVQFKVGGLSDANDSIKFPIPTKWIELSTEWRQFTIDLSGKDLSNVVGGFCLVTNLIKNRGKEEIWVYLDNIRFELN